MCEPILELQSFSYPFGVTVTLSLTFGLSSRIILCRVFEVGIPNLVCGYIIGSRSDAYCFWVTVTLTLASVLEKSCREHISDIILGRNSKFGVWIHIGFAEYQVLFLGH